MRINSNNIHSIPELSTLPVGYQVNKVILITANEQDGGETKRDPRARIGSLMER